MPSMMSTGDEYWEKETIKKLIEAELISHELKDRNPTPNRLQVRTRFSADKFQEVTDQVKKLGCEADLIDKKNVWIYLPRRRRYSLLIQGSGMIFLSYALFLIYCYSYEKIFTFF